MAGPGFSKKAAGDGDFRNPYAKGYHGSRPNAKMGKSGSSGPPAEKNTGMGYGDSTGPHSTGYMKSGKMGGKYGHQYD